jgi:hypothetical protein
VTITDRTFWPCSQARPATPTESDPRSRRAASDGTGHRRWATARTRPARRAMAHRSATGARRSAAVSPTSAADQSTGRHQRGQHGPTVRSCRLVTAKVAATPVRSPIAQRIREALGGAAWAVDANGLPKWGRASPWVARQSTGTAAKFTSRPVAGSVTWSLDAGPSAARRVTWRDSSHHRAGRPGWVSSRLCSGEVARPAGPRTPTAAR